MLKLARAVLPVFLLLAPLLSGCGDSSAPKSSAPKQSENDRGPVAGGAAPESDGKEKPSTTPPDSKPRTADKTDPAKPAAPTPADREREEDLTRGLGEVGSRDHPAAAAPPPAPATPPPPPGAAGTVDQKYDVVPVYFGTDRAQQPGSPRLTYGSERGHKLELGRALVTVPAAHKVPEVERPWVIEIPYFKVKVYEEKEDPAKHFTIQEIGALSKEQLLAFVKERLAGSKNFKDHALVFVHGFNTPFDYAVYRTAQIAYDLKFDGAPFLYSWPSGGKVASYTYDRGSAEQAEPHLAEFLNMVAKESGAKSVSLIAHSMGNELLLRVLERLPQAAPDGVKISQVILAAPDVDRDKFTNIAREIANFAQGVTLYAASNDRALGYSARFWGGVPRAGDVPEGGPLVIPGVDTIDVTSVSTDSLGLNHSGYAENNALLNDIKLLIQTGERPPDKRIPILERVTAAAGGAYWRYPASAR